MSESPPAAWHSDPFGRFDKRYWNGARWTEHVASGGSQGVDPPVHTPLATPDVQVPPSWHRDPLGRHEMRSWDGGRWTEHVQSRGLQSVDPPNALVPTAPGGRPSSKVTPRVRDHGPVTGRRDRLDVLSMTGASGGHAGGTLLTAQVLVVNQKANVFRSKLGYGVFNRGGQQLGMVQELRRSLSSTLRDHLRGRKDEYREHRFRLVDTSDRVVFEMTRPRAGFFQGKGKLIIDGPGGGPIGQIVLESAGLGGAVASAAQFGVNSASTIAFLATGGIAGLFAAAALEGLQDKLDTAVEGWDKVGHARFGLEAAGQRLGSVHADNIQQWDFYVQDPGGIEVARITKTWAGWAKERFTKADNYVVQMHRPLHEPLRSLVIAAALAIDMELKQHGDQTSGSSLWGTRTYD